MKISRHIKSLFQIMILLSLCCCASPQTPKIACIRDGMKYGQIRGIFREKFWSYYERGLSYSEGQCFDAAIADFESAIRLNSDDQRKARTYGVEFIDYFPHRELGRIYFETGDLEAARKELEFSIAQYPSAKAAYYLGKVLKAMFEAEGKTPSKPFIRLENNNIQFTSSKYVFVEGSVEDKNGISTIKINDIPITTVKQLVSKKHFFSKRLFLVEGKNVIKVEAENLLMKKTIKEIVINIDRQGPLVTIENMNINDNQIVISGFLSDDAGVSGLLINKQPISIRQDVDTEFSAQIPKDTDKLELAAKDSLGNETVMQVSDIGQQYAMLLANSDLIMADVSPSRQNTDSPHIQLMGGLSDTQTVYQEELYVQAEVSSTNKIRSLKINGKPIVRRQAKMISFGEMIKLKEGENRIVIEASDIEGRISTKELMAIRKIPKAFQLEERLGLVVSLFEPEFENNDITKKTARDFQAALERAFHSKKRFRVLKEKEDCRITGRVIEGSDLEFFAEMIDAETKESLVIADVYHQKKSREILKELAEGMANIFIRKYPLLTGDVLNSDGKQIATNIGRKSVDNDAKIPKRLIVYRDTPMDIIIGNAQIISAREDKSTAELVKGDPKELKPSDKVITR